MIGIESPIWETMFGVPSLLGRIGGMLVLLLLLVLRLCPKTLRGGGSNGESSKGDIITGFAGAFEVLEGELLMLGGDSLNFVEDFLGGGLGGKGESLFFFFFFSFESGVFVLPSPFTVEFDDDEVIDSRNSGKP